MDLDTSTRDERIVALRELIPVDSGAKRRVGIELLRSVLRSEANRESEAQ